MIKIWNGSTAELLTTLTCSSSYGFAEPALPETTNTENMASRQEIKGSPPTTMDVLNSTSSSQISENSTGSDVPSVSKLRKEMIMMEVQRWKVQLAYGMGTRGNF
jgi:hypothetical protein